MPNDLPKNTLQNYALLKNVLLESSFVARNASKKNQPESQLFKGRYKKSITQSTSRNTDKEIFTTPKFDNTDLLKCDVDTILKKKSMYDILAIQPEHMHKIFIFEDIIENKMRYLIQFKNNNKCINLKLSSSCLSSKTVVALSELDKTDVVDKYRQMIILIQADVRIAITKVHISEPIKSLTTAADKIHIEQARKLSRRELEHRLYVLKRTYDIVPQQNDRKTNATDATDAYNLNKSPIGFILKYHSTKSSEGFFLEEKIDHNTLLPATVAMFFQQQALNLESGLLACIPKKIWTILIEDVLTQLKMLKKSNDT
jgi:hypothetical protein